MQGWECLMHGCYFVVFYIMMDNVRSSSIFNLGQCPFANSLTPPSYTSQSPTITKKTYSNTAKQAPPSILSLNTQSLSLWSNSCLSIEHYNYLNPIFWYGWIYLSLYCLDGIVVWDCWICSLCFLCCYGRRVYLFLGYGVSVPLFFAVRSSTQHPQYSYYLPDPKTTTRATKPSPNTKPLPFSHQHSLQQYHYKLLKCN